MNENGRYYQQVRHGETWQDANEFTLEEMPLIDRVVANWYTSTHPQSHFKSQVIAARALDNGQRITLLNYDFTLRERSGESHKKALQSHQEIVEVLMHDFGLQLNQEDQKAIQILKDS